MDDLQGNEDVSYFCFKLSSMTRIMAFPLRKWKSAFKTVWSKYLPRLTGTRRWYRSGSMTSARRA